MIDTENLTRKLGNLTAVDNLTLHVDEGEVFGFLGPNGAGKATTVRMLWCYLYYPNLSIGIILLLVVPLAEILSIELSVIASSRVSDVRAANQIGGLMFIPFMIYISPVR